MAKDNFDDHFEVVPASVADIDEICRIFCESLEHDALNIAINGKISYEDRVKHVRETMQGPKFANPAYIWYKAVDRQKDGRMAGWACMRKAMPDPAGWNAYVTGFEPEGLNMTVLNYLAHEVNGKLLSTSEYEKELHFARSGLHVHPDYQRRGVASRLSKALNEISDREQRVTFVKTRPAATRFFMHEGGWTKINEIPIPYRDLGVDLEGDSMTAFRREPQVLKD